MDAKDSGGQDAPVYNKDIMNAVKWLYCNEKIEKDKDIVDKTGYVKSTVSSYIKGKIKASPEFRTKFEEVFDLRLSEFVNGWKIESQNLSAMDTKSIEDKYLNLLEKTLSEKEDDLKSYRSAIDKITSVNQDMNSVKSTVDALQGKWKDYEPMILGLREFVTGEIATLRKKSHEEVAAALNIKVEEQKNKVEQSYIQKG